MKKIFLLIMLLFLAPIGCYKQQVVCNDPYIFLGSECCLDRNSNKICDEDENNERLSPSHSMMDLQKTLGTIMGRNILIEKDVYSNETQFYIDKENKFLPISSCTSGCAGTVFVKKLKINSLAIGHLPESEINTENFYSYILSKRNYLLNQTNILRSEFETEFETEAGLNRYYTKDDFSEYPFANFTIKENKIYDNITVLSELSDGYIIELDYASISEYYSTYGSKKITGFINRKEQQLDFTQAISILCRPDLVIILYGDKYDWRTLINKNIYPEDVINQFEVNQELLLPKAKAILDMCQNKYQYGAFLVD
jgi:hypothetical protein